MNMKDQLSILTAGIALFNITNQEFEEKFRFQLDITEHWSGGNTGCHKTDSFANSVVLSFFLCNCQVYMFVSVLVLISQERTIVLPFSFVFKGCESFVQLSLCTFE